MIRANCIHDILCLKFYYVLIKVLRDEVTGGWRKLHNKKLHDLYSLPFIIRMIKSRRIRWVGHVARIGEKGKARRKETARKIKT
jgi:hypothetical protein